MLARLSVKKPYLVLVAVIISLLLGGVSLSYMKTNLLPEFSVPYLAVMTTDVGASPEQVQSDVTEVLEGELSSVSGVKNVTSYSMENYSMVLLEFTDDTDMDSALVKVSAACNTVAGQLPDTAGTPSYMEMNMDMMASVYLGVTSDQMDLAQLSDFVEDTVVPALERQSNVASVSVSGEVTNTVTVELDQDKIDLVNDGILGSVNDELSKAKDKIDQGENQIESALAKLDSSESKLKESQAKIEEGQKALDAAKEAAKPGLSQLDTANAMKASYEAQVSLLQARIQAATAMGDTATATQLQSELAVTQQALEAIDKQMGDNATTSAETVLTLVDQQRQLDQASSSITQGLASISSTRAQLESSKSQIAQSRATYEENRDNARSNANIDKLLDISTLSQLISAQNLEMPAGYVKTDTSDNADKWLVKVGQSIKDTKELKNLVLTKIDGVGKVRLSDVANIVTADNEGDSYANLNGQDGIVLSVTKSPTANTGDMSKQVNDQIAQLESQNEGLDLIKVMDQGDYIDLYIATILKTLLLGALLAVIVLAVFLRDVKPTLIVAFAIPFSVLFALLVMYFTGLDLNIMTLGAMSLAIGMLVDNGIVVMENIYRLRQQGYAPARAAAQGARQVSAAVVASTLTTICVFLPMVFTSGTVRQLLVPFALTLSYVLIASLLVALTVVPALGSVLFKNMKTRSETELGRVQTAYGKALGWCLTHKAPVLVLAAALLGGSVYGALNMGVVLIPEMSSDQIMFTLEMPDDMEKEDAYEVADQVVDAVAGVDGIADVGCVDDSFTSSMMTASASQVDTYTGTFILYGMVDSSKVNTETQMKEVTTACLDAASGFDCEVSSSDSMESMSSMMSAGLQVKVSGADSDKVLDLAQDVVEVVKGVEGYSEVSDGQEDADETLHLMFDKNKLGSMGMTVGQVYQQLSSALTTSAKSFTMTDQEGNNIDVNVDDEEYESLVKSNLMSWKFEDNNGDKHKLSSVATLETEAGLTSLQRSNGAFVCNVTADIDDGYNTTLLVRELQPKLDQMDVPSGYTVEIAGTDETIQDMLRQMLLLAALGFLLVYLVMVAQFQSLLSPFIIIFTVPLAFTGGFIALYAAGEQISMMSLLGFVILMGTIVNNGIVFVDYANRLRLGGVAKRAALIATGQTRMRPILMTALTTILAMAAMIFSQEIGAGMERGMALVVAGGLLYGTFMTLFVVPIIYDIFSRKPLYPIDLGGDIDDEAQDAAAVIKRMGPDAIETYEYETARQRRRRLKKEGGAHGKRAQAKEQLAAQAAQDAAGNAGEAGVLAEDAPAVEEHSMADGNAADAKQEEQ